MRKLVVKSDEIANNIVALRNRQIIDVLVKVITNSKSIILKSDLEKLKK